jgi:UDP-GlcNAc3NAcA epimerase
MHAQAVAWSGSSCRAIISSLTDAVSNRGVRLRKTIYTVVGARPQFVKAAVVSGAMAKDGRVDEVLIHTGQHYDFSVSGALFRQLRLPDPDHNLGVGSGHHGEQTAKMLHGVEQLLMRGRPDCVLVYGDTNSTLAGALAAAKLHIPVAHVEAGMRSFNRRMPEEVNRIVVDHVSEVLFAPTATAMANLAAERLDSRAAHLVGDVMFDAALMFAPSPADQNAVLERLGLSKGGYALSTIHRAENTDEPDRLSAVLGGLAEFAQDLEVVFPVHPRTQVALEQLTGSSSFTARLKLLPPIGYLEMLVLERCAAVIATDSGGVQKEAFFFGVPCVTLRDETEWTELVDTGWNRVIPPTDPIAIAAALRAAVGSRGHDSRPFGDGRAGEMIAEILASI